VSLTLFNVLGDTVGVAWDGVMDSVMTFDFDSILTVWNRHLTESGTSADSVETLPGIYFYRIETPDTVITKKLVLLK
jgi:hypothetical protein